MTDKTQTTLDELPEVEFLTSAEMNNLTDDEREKYQFDGDASAYRGYMCFRRKKEYGGQ